MSDEWRRAMGMLSPEEGAELEALLRGRAERVGQPASSLRGKPEVAAPEPRRPDNRIWFIPDDPQDPLGSFRDRSKPGDAAPWWVDGV